jgi:hypothetical protein
MKANQVNTSRRKFPLVEGKGEKERKKERKKEGKKERKKEIKRGRSQIVTHDAHFFQAILHLGRKSKK